MKGRCENCDTERDGRYCSKCGSGLVRKPTDNPHINSKKVYKLSGMENETKRCPNCQTELPLKKGDKFCNNCGHRLEVNITAKQLELPDPS